VTGTDLNKVTLADLEAEIAELRRRLARLEVDDAAADTISDFCRRHQISRAYYYVLKRAGRGPREMRPGPGGTGPRLISREAQADWRREREAETAAAAREAESKLGMNVRRALAIEPAPPGSKAQRGLPQEFAPGKSRDQ
jgi:hypothetical protein